MPDTITLTGVIATTPRHITTTEGLEITSFRLASSQRRFDRQQNSWVDMGTNWYTVTAFRQLASNLAASVAKGDRVVAAGRLRIREWENAEKSGMTVEIEAESVGHDLGWGTTTFQKSLQSGSAAAAAGPGPSSDDGREASGSLGAGGGLGPGGWTIPGSSHVPGSPHEPGSGLESGNGLEPDGFTPASTADSERDAHAPHLDSTRL
ncbi:hypothetical protein B7R54_05720 [Subtercola boreus]|uniref:Single-stranded DNA-binding protein n=1 Tax=Subtercola boreus TaxID=120213 RepID=A0A3E0VGI3_9MICO|nr:single-stranded DNA-binding protein [Subtercola boreus]RFA08779.1 hypothetical protein B7R54_05720 [Subtercola boreus]TQL54258.1 single-strand DNA-binding protein [Subtercola boreus]